MLRSLSLLVLATLLCSLFSCKKDTPRLPTIVKGTVVDSKTGEPIPNALIEISNRVPKDIGFDNIPEYALSNLQGNFSYTVRSDAAYASLFSISAENFAYKRTDSANYKVIMETTNEYSIPLIRSDAVLVLYIKNQTGQQNNVYITINNPTVASEAKSPLYYSPVFSTGEDQYLTLPLVANEYTKIYWSLENFISNQTIPTHRDSVYLLLNDTLNYSIIF